MHLNAAVLHAPQCRRRWYARSQKPVILWLPRHRLTAIPIIPTAASRRRRRRAPLNTLTLLLSATAAPLHAASPFSLRKQLHAVGIGVRGIGVAALRHVPNIEATVLQALLRRLLQMILTARVNCYTSLDTRPIRSPAAADAWESVGFWGSRNTGSCQGDGRSTAETEDLHVYCETTRPVKMSKAAPSRTFSCWSDGQHSPPGAAAAAATSAASPPGP